jgi:hypothetical protein
LGKRKKDNGKPQMLLKIIIKSPPLLIILMNSRNLDILENNKKKTKLIIQKSRIKQILIRKEDYLNLTFQIKKNSKIINKNLFLKKEKNILKVLIKTIIILTKNLLFLEEKRKRKMFLIHFRKKQLIH